MFQGDWTNKVEHIKVARWYYRIEEILASKRVLRAKYLRSLVFEHSSINNIDNTDNIFSNYE